MSRQRGLLLLLRMRKRVGRRRCVAGFFSLSLTGEGRTRHFLFSFYSRTSLSACLTKSKASPMVSHSSLARQKKNTGREKDTRLYSAGLFLPLPFISPSVLPRGPTFSDRRRPMDCGYSAGHRRERNRIPGYLRRKRGGGGPRRRNGRSPPPPPVSAKWSAVALPPPRPLRFQPNLTGKG